MEVQSDSAALRRELRKQKLLQNAELRKKKIFGLSPTKNFENEEISTFTENDVSKSSLDNLVFTPPTSHSKLQSDSKFNEAPSHPHNMMNDAAFSNLTHAGQHNESHTLFNNVNTSRDCDISGRNLLQSTRINTENVNRSYLCIESGNVAFPLFLSLIASFLLTVKLGYLIGNNLIAPFVLWEFQVILAELNYSKKNSDDQFLTNTILMVFGIKKDKIGEFVSILKLLHTIFIDFSVYILTAIVWFVLVGFSL